MTDRADNVARAQAFAVLATLLWPLQEAAGAVLMRGHHAAQVVAFRYITHLLLLGAFVLPRYGLRPFMTQRPGLQMLRGLCMFGMPGGFMLAAGVAPISWVWTVFWLMPAMALAGAWLFLNERPGWFAWAVAFAGPLAAAAIGEAVPGSPAGTAGAVLMGASFAGYVVLSRVLRREHLIASLFYTAVGALLPMAYFAWRVWTPVTAAEIIPAFITGLLSLLILGAFDKATDAAPVTIVAPIIPMVLLWEFGLKVLQHQTTVFTADIAGITLVSLSCVLWLSSNYLQERRQRKSA